MDHSELATATVVAIADHFGAVRSGAGVSERASQTVAEIVAVVRSACGIDTPIIGALRRDPDDSDVRDHAAALLKRTLHDDERVAPALSSALSRNDLDDAPLVRIQAQDALSIARARRLSPTPERDVDRTLIRLGAGLLVVGLIIGVYFVARILSAPVSADSTCDDYLRLPVQDRAEAVLRIGLDLHNQDAGNPLMRFSVDYACGISPETTLGAVLGRPRGY
ncbi:hypothetical protein OG738_31790 [Amycolatopsis sp. NBC_01488]|uniref:hypothetical protein n=1 Tax=Amycolatopsis sp. NBC_01488 TaxID=2903563 RepID=UPI002E2DB24C|nr:hypothetical protein [Amycolatopsis sp. NBC_01488]